MQLRAAAVSALLATTLAVTVMSVPAAADDQRGDPVAEQVGTVQAELLGSKKRERQSKSEWRPKVGAVFNNPYGGMAERFKIERRILEAIRHSRKGDEIRIAIYSFDRQDIARALVKARKRGVQVQILLNDHQVTRAQRILKQGIGRNPKKDNFSYECQSSCRGRRDNLHSKFYLFSSPGAAKHVIMTGSANLTLNAVKWQWNDLYVMRKKARLYADFVRLFNQMRHDWSKNKRTWEFCGEADRSKCKRIKSKRYGVVFPRNVNKHGDVALQALNSTRCTYPTGSGMARTKVRLSMHTMRGSRAEKIADRLRTMWARGCDIKVLYGLMGFPVKRKLGAPTSRGRIPLRSTGYDYNGDADVDRYTHQKYLTIRGHWGGDPTARVAFTGSSNWSNKGLGGDEIVFNVHSAGDVADYNRNWDFMWNRHSRNAYTTTSSQYRTVVPVWDGDVMTHEVVTRTVTTTEVLPDRLGTGSPTFESD